MIDVDSDSDFVHLFEVTKTYSETVDYHRSSGALSLIVERANPKFYGKLDALLLTNEKLANAAPIQPEFGSDAHENHDYSPGK